MARAWAQREAPLSPAPVGAPKRSLEPEIDSEEEAYNVMSFTVDTQRREELMPYLPRHLRKLAAPKEDDADLVVPYAGGE